MKINPDEDEVYKKYQEYARTHKATKKNPLRTYSGWLHMNKIRIFDLREVRATRAER
jgi:hypothetical protein